MRRVLVIFGITLAVLGALFAIAAPPASAGPVAKPIDSGVDLTMQVGQLVYAPGDIVEIHFWVTNNGSLLATPADFTFTTGWPHAHPPNLGAELPDGTTQSLIAIDVPVIWGHAGAYRTSMVAPSAPGLYAVHGAVTVGGLLIFGFASYSVVAAEIAAVAQLSLFWSIAAFVAAVITLAIVIVIAVRKW